MTATILTRWKLLLNLTDDRFAALPRLFNTDTGRSFMRAMGGRATVDFAPVTLTCTSRFFDLLRDTYRGLGFSGRKFPLRHGESGVDLHMRFRVYGSVLAIEVSRSPIALPATEVLEAILFDKQRAFFELTKAVLGLIEHPEPGFGSSAELPKIFYCNRIVGSEHALPSNQLLVEILTRHRKPSEMLVSSVQERNRPLQSDSSTLLVDRQGVLVAIPSSDAEDATVIRRFDAACNMLEMVSSIQRLLERGSIGELRDDELRDIDNYFQAPDERFLFSTSSREIWKRLASEFALSAERWPRLRDDSARAARQQGSLMKKIMVVTALDTEAAPIIAALKSRGPVSFGEVFATRGMIEHEGNRASVYVCIAGVGNTQAAIETSNMWRLINPDLTIFVGIAGGRKEATIGSVVIANRVYNYESGKEQKKGFAPRPRDITPSRKAASLIGAFLGELRNQPAAFQVFNKAIACGEKVLASTRGASAQVVARTYDDALAVEMEGFGFLAALEANSAPAVLVRGISDRLDKKSQEENHELAIRNATEIVIRIVQFFLTARDEE